MNFNSRQNIFSWSQKERGAYIREGANIRGNTVPVYLFFTFIHKRNNATVTIFLKFMSIFLKSIFSSFL